MMPLVADTTTPAAGGRRPGWPLVLASLVVGAALVALVAYDAIATRRELLGLLREQALALRETVSAAARSNRAAAAFSEAQLGERLLDRARALAALDREGRLTPAALEEARQRDPLFRLGLFRADGTREDAEPAGGAAPGSVAGRGFGPGPGPGQGQGQGQGQGRGRGLRGGGQALRQVLEEGRDEAVTGAHAPRWGGTERVAAAVRREGGGAVVISVDASAVARLEEPASLSRLLGEITHASPEIAYMTLGEGEGRLVFGDAPDGPAPAPGERTLDVADRPVLEFTSDVSGDAAGEPVLLQLGLRLDGVRRVERRMTARLALSVLVAGALAALAFSLAGLGRRYGVLSRQHALAEEALRRRDRLAAMGELASTVAHEVRNPLNAVGMTAQRLRREFLESVPDAAAGRAELTELLDVMSSETQRIDRIVQQFLDYARPPRLAPQRVDLGGLVAGIAEQQRPVAEARGVTLDAEVAEAGPANVDPSQLRQALDNLVRNAIEATPRGGRVEVVARCAGGGCVVEVRDTGSGIEPDHLPKIFDLYFTTKVDGTGVGLPVTQQIVSAHGGTIEVDSRPGGGTTMTVRLPAGKEARA
jgi:signal transduction histidine kinase